MASVQEVFVGRFSRYLVLWSVVVAMSISTLGCAPKSPEEKIAELRSFYSARLNGFIVEEEPIVAEMEWAADVEIQEEAPEAEPEVEADSELETDLEVAPEPLAVRQSVRLDILIQHRASERLPGITVEISMADAAGNEKGHWRVWFDTSDVEKATVTQFTHILEDVGYEEGDGFLVEVRHPVPEQERGEYREFAQAS